MKDEVTMPKWLYYLLILSLILNISFHTANIIQEKPKVNIYIHDERGVNGE